MTTGTVLRRGYLAAGLVLAAGLAALGAVELGRSTGTLGAWWPAAGIGVAAALLAPPGRRGHVVGGLLLALTLGNALAGRTLVEAVLLALVGTAEVVVVVLVLLRTTGGRLRRTGDVGRLALAVVAGAVIAGTGASLVYSRLLGVPFGELLAVSVLAHAVAVLLIAPLAMVDWSGPRPPWHGALAHAALTGALVAAAFGPVTDGLAGMVVMALPLPLMMWAATRFDHRLVLLELVWLAVVVTLTAVAHTETFTQPRAGGSPNVLVAEVYLLVCATIALPLALALLERDDATRRTRESERTFRRAFTGSGLPVVLCEWRDGRLLVTEASNASAGLLGRAPADLVGTDLADLVSAPGLWEQLGTGPAAGLPGWSGPIGVLASPDARVDGFCSTLEVGEGRVLVSLHLVDLTDRFALQRRLEAERTWTRAVMDTAASMLVVTDVEGTVIAVNPATERLTGYAADELVGRPLWETLIPEHLRHGVTDALSNVLPLPRSGELSVRTRSGEIRTVEFSHSAHHEPRPGTLETSTTLVFSATDVTEARESAGVVDHLLRSVTSIAFVGTDLQGRITMFSTGAERLLGLDADRVRGRPVASLLRAVPPEGEEHARPRTPGFDELVGHLGPESNTRTGDWLMLPDGREPVRVSVTCSPVRSEQGTVHAYLFVARDVTETRRNQEILVNALRREREVVTRLQDLDRAKDDFISTVSHELRTPMSSIIGSAEMLAEGMVGELEPRQRQLVEVISRNGDRLLGLADDLLTLAAFDQGGRSPRGGELDLRDVVSQSIRTVQPPSGERDLAWQVRLPRQPVVVVGDPSHLERAVTNLLTNAVKFTPDGGRIEASLTADAGLRTATVTVRDTGRGIAATDLDHVFDRFYRSEESQRHAIQGSGLGLSIVKSIVESHEGRVAVDSTQGEGTAVSISIPLARPPRPRRPV